MRATGRGTPSIYRLTAQGRSVLFRRGERVRIGRDPGNELVLDDSSVSRVHGRVEWARRPGPPVVVDLGSSNGTYVDGVRRVRAPLSELSKLVIGDVRVSLLLVQGAAATGPGAPTRRLDRLADERWSDSRGYLRAAEGVHALLFELERSRRTASFSISDKGFEGRVTFARGRIIDVTAGESRGLSALQQLLSRLEGGNYVVTRDVESHEQVVTALPNLHDVLARLTPRLEPTGS